MPNIGRVPHYTYLSEQRGYMHNRATGPEAADSIAQQAAAQGPEVFTIHSPRGLQAFDEDAVMVEIEGAEGTQGFGEPMN